MRACTPLIFCVSLILASPPTLAHHSVDAEFDISRHLELTGIVTKVEWTNPHTWIYLDAQNPVSGRIEKWAWETASPNGLRRRGWTENSLQAGDIVTVSGNPSRNGSNKANALSVVLADGEQLLFPPADVFTIPEP